MSQDDYFLGMPRQNTYGNYRPAYETQEVPFDHWWPMYSKAMYILARTFQPKTPEDTKAIQVFFVNLFKLVPNSSARSYLAQFYVMKPNIIALLKSTVPGVFQSYYWLEDMLVNRPQEFHQMCFQNADKQALFLWVYLIHVMFLGAINTQQHTVKYPIPTLSHQRSLYQVEQMDIKDWGNAFWFVLHTSALYAPREMEDSFKNYRNVIIALQYLLPCPKCREHLKQNLKWIDFDTCGRTNLELFKCSWKLHNIVNQSINKPLLDLQLALSLYTF